LKSVVISTKQLQMEQAAEKAAKDRSELESALQQRWKKQSDLMEKEAEEAAKRKREHDLLLESALSDIEQKRDLRRGTTMQSSIQNETAYSNEISKTSFSSITENADPDQDSPPQIQEMPTVIPSPPPPPPERLSYVVPPPPPPPPPLPLQQETSTTSISNKEESKNLENSVDDRASSTVRKNSSNGPSSIIPLAGSVLKTVDKETETKVFINITHHSDIVYDTSALIRHGNDFQSAVYVCEVGETLDQSGTVSFVVDVIIYTDYYNTFQESQSNLCALVIDAVVKSTGLDLDNDFKLPKIMGNYKVSSNHNSPPPVALPLIVTSYGVRKSSNIKNIASKSSKARKSEESVNFATLSEQNEWSFYVEDGESIIAVGLIGKKNPIGLMHKRQLILSVKKTSGDGKLVPRLFYVDPASKTIKGEITFVNFKEYASKQTKTIARVTDMQNQIFEIETIDRIYSFKDLSSGTTKGAAWWANVINTVASKYF